MQGETFLGLSSVLLTTHTLVTTQLNSSFNFFLGKMGNEDRKKAKRGKKRGERKTKEVQKDLLQWPKRGKGVDVVLTSWRKREIPPHSQILVCRRIFFLPENCPSKIQDLSLKIPNLILRKFRGKTEIMSTEHSYFPSPKFAAVYQKIAIICHFFNFIVPRRSGRAADADGERCDCIVARGVVGTVHVGTVQGAVTHVVYKTQDTVTHAVYRLRTLSAAEHHRRLADHGQYADRCDVLRAVRRSLDHTDSVLRHLQTTLPWKGKATLFYFTKLRAVTRDVRIRPTVRSLLGGLVNFSVVYRCVNLLTC